MKQPSKSLQLISYNQSTSRFQLNEKALIFLQNLDKPLAITTISGSICSGKSYILNQIIGEQDFIVSSKSLPETKGIWMSKTPALSLDQKYYHVFLDGQGLSSIDKDSDYDIKLLLLSMIISSTFVYNSFGAIEQSSLEIIRSSLGLKKYCGQWNKLGFGDLIWIARDFNLRLVDREGNKISEKNYLNSALREMQNERGEDNDAKNETRKVLRDTFSNKYCYTLPRPTINQSILRDLSNNQKKIKPQFLSKIAQIRKDIICRSKPKQLNDCFVTCSTFVSMLKSLIKNINSIGGISTSTWDSIAFHNKEKTLQNCLNKFYSKLISLQLSLPNPTLDSILKQLFEQIHKQYSIKTLSFQDSSGNLQDLKSTMQKSINEIQNKNSELLKRSYILEFEQLWNNLSVHAQLEHPNKLKQLLEKTTTKLSQKQQYIKYSQKLIEVVVNLSSKLQYFNIQLQHHSLKQLKQDYQLIKTFNSKSLSNIRILQQRIKQLEINISKIQKYNLALSKQSEQLKAALNKDKFHQQSIMKQNRQLRVSIKQYQFKIKTLQQDLKNKEQENESQVKIFLQQKRVNQEQSKFYESQIKGLKENVQIIKVNHQRSNVGLLQNNQILKRLEMIKNRDSQNRDKQKDINKDKQNKYQDEIRLKQLKEQVLMFEAKTKKLESSVIELSEKVRKQQEYNVNLRNQLDFQMEINKQSQESKKSYEDMVVALENNLEVIQAAQEREKKLYEQSVLRLIENVERRQEQYKRKLEMRDKYSRHQY